MTGNETEKQNNFFGDTQSLFLKTLISKGSLRKTFQKFIFNSKAQNIEIKSASSLILTFNRQL